MLMLRDTAYSHPPFPSPQTVAGWRTMFAGPSGELSRFDPAPGLALLTDSGYHHCPRPEERTPDQGAVPAFLPGRPGEQNPSSAHQSGHVVGTSFASVPRGDQAPCGTPGRTRGGHGYRDTDRGSNVPHDSSAAGVAMYRIREERQDVPTHQSQASRTVEEAVEASLVFERIVADGVVTPEERLQMRGQLRTVVNVAEVTEANERAAISILRTGRVVTHLKRTHGHLLPDEAA